MLERGLELKPIFLSDRDGGSYTALCTMQLIEGRNVITGPFQRDMITLEMAEIATLTTRFLDACVPLDLFQDREALAIRINGDNDTSSNAGRRAGILRESIKAYHRYFCVFEKAYLKYVFQHTHMAETGWGLQRRREELSDAEEESSDDEHRRRRLLGAHGA